LLFARLLRRRLAEIVLAKRTQHEEPRVVEQRQEAKVGVDHRLHVAVGLTKLAPMLIHLTMLKCYLLRREKERAREKYSTLFDVPIDCKPDQQTKNDPSNCVGMKRQRVLDSIYIKPSTISNNNNTITNTYLFVL
jgi:hypothetical protein